MLVAVVGVAVAVVAERNQRKLFGALDERAVGGARLRMLKRGIYVIGFSFPVVPKGQARIRTQMSAAHSSTDIDRAVEAFGAIGRELGVIT